MSKNRQTEALFIAINNGDIKLVRKLIENGNDVNATDGDKGYTSLSKAIDCKQYAIVKLLLENGASIEATANYSKKTVLHKAVKAKDYITIECILEHGPQIDRPIKLSIALEEAQKCVNNDMVRFLEEKGAKIGVLPVSRVPLDSLEIKPVKKTVTQINKPIISVAVDKTSKNKFVKKAITQIERANPTIDPELSKAVDTDDLDLLASLLGSGANINATDIFGDTLLARTIKENKLTVANSLLANGARGNENQKTALLWKADEFNDLNLVKTLLQLGFNINITDIYEDTLISRALKEDKLDWLRSLLENGADINESNGCIVLSKAFAQGKLGLVKAVLKKGANIECLERSTYLGYRNFQDFLEIFSELEAKDVARFLNLANTTKQIVDAATHLCLNEIMNNLEGMTIHKFVLCLHPLIISDMPTSVDVYITDAKNFFRIIAVCKNITTASVFFENQDIAKLIIAQGFYLQDFLQKEYLPIEILGDNNDFS